MSDYKLLKQLVKFNTIKDKENKKIIDFIENYLLKLGFKTEYKEKSLIMSYGENPSVGFLGHTDTVEYIEGWNTNPFELAEKDGKLFGLGACDMKGGIAAMLDAVSGIDLSTIKNGIKLYFTDDEEIGFGGIYKLVEIEKKFPKLMIFGEPTNNEILVGSKGLLEFELNFKGAKAHSSNPEKGKSANMNAVKFLIELEDFYKENIRKDENKNYEIPYTTMNVGIINGGSAKNSVSASCNVMMDFRTIKNKHAENIIEKVNELSKKYNCNVKIIEKVDPFINETDLAAETKTANFITEASFVKAQTKIILGPGPVTAHEVNEYITEESYEKLVKQYTQILEKMCITKR